MIVSETTGTGSYVMTLMVRKLIRKKEKDDKAYITLGKAAMRSKNQSKWNF